MPETHRNSRASSVRALKSGELTLESKPNYKLFLR
jgi:hypothetical protein